MSFISIVQFALDSGKPTLFFLDKWGELDQVSIDPCEGNEAERFPELIEKASSPFFQVCSILGGVVTDALGDVLFTPEEPLAEDVLGKVLTAAEKERERFYAERAEAHGPSAWPLARVMVAASDGQKRKSVR